MSYVALYRKFRPQRFEDVKGQDAVVTTLTNQIRAGRIGHAYLFCGTRGTGKTTAAKLFARAVNCESPILGSPCGKCPMCERLASGASLNVIEIDAASNNGVDNIREIKEEVEYRPTEGRYKVYIIDEAHMLSAGAFNALLKTLEEPPEYVIFILATTEAHKIPVTILSRCQRYDFKRISAATIAERLFELIEEEGLDVEERAARYIARAADGSMRDALSLLDRCAAFYIGERLTYGRVLETLGAVDTDVFSRLFREILKKDVKGAIEALDGLIMQGCELTRLAEDFIWYLRNLLLLKSADNMEEMLDVSEESLLRLREERELIEDGELIRYIRIFSELIGQLRTAAKKRTLIEVTLIKLCRPSMEVSQDALLSRIRALEEAAERGAFAAPPPKERARPKEEREKEETKKPLSPPKKAVSGDVRAALESFPRIREGASNMLREVLKKATPQVGENGCLRLSFSDEMSADIVGMEGHRQELLRLLEERVGKAVELEIRYAPQEKSSGGGGLSDIQKHIHMEITEENEG